MRGRIVAFVVAMTLGCKSSDEVAPTQVECGADEVRDEDRCTKVGVDACAEGFAADGRGGCAAVLPPKECGDGELAAPGDGACVTVGARACGDGFEADGKGGCRVVLPATACDATSLATPGDAACRPLAECGTGRWAPGLPTDTPITYVDAAFVGASDGSEARPFPTIQAAIDAATVAGTTVAIAAGTYVENLDVPKPVRLVGRCPSLVTVRAVDAVKAPTVRIHADAELRSLSFTAPATTATSVVQISDANARIERVRIHDSSAIAVRVQRASKLTRAVLRDVLVERPSGLGVWGVGAELDVERLVVRDVHVDADGYGRGLEIDSGGPTLPGSLKLASSVVEDLVDTGIVIAGSDASIKTTLVRRVKGAAATKIGFGISAEPKTDDGRGSTLALDGVVIEDTHFAGVNLFGSKGDLKNVTVRRCRALGDRITGPGSGVAITPQPKFPADLVLRDARIEDCDDDGLYLKGPKATVANVVIHGVGRASPDGRARGVTIGAADDGTPPEVSLDRLLVERTDGMGVFTGAGHVTLARSEIRDETAAALQKGNGCLAVTGVPTAPMPELSADHVWVHRCQGDGVLAQEAKLTLTASLVSDTTPRTGEQTFGRGVEVSAFDGIPSEVTITGSVITRTTRIGIITAGSKLAIDRSTISHVSGVQIEGSPTVSNGIVAQNVNAVGGSTLEVRRSLVADVAAVGIYVVNSTVTVDQCLVRDIKGLSGFGDGISARRDPLTTVATVTRTLFRDNARAGVSVFGAELSLASSILRCNAIDLDVEPFRSVPPRVSDAGGNACGCGALGLCRGQSANLTPVPWEP